MFFFVYSMFLLIPFSNLFIGSFRFYFQLHFILFRFFVYSFLISFSIYYSSSCSLSLLFCSTFLLLPISSSFLIFLEFFADLLIFLILCYISPLQLFFYFVTFCRLNKFLLISFSNLFLCSFQSFFPIPFYFIPAFLICFFTPQSIVSVILKSVFVPLQGFCRRILF